MQDNDPPQQQPQQLRTDIQALQQQVQSLEILITERFTHLEKMIEQRFGHLEERNLQHVNESLHKMNLHIDFINETYTTLQSPLNYVKNKVERLMGYETFVQLPLPLLPSFTAGPTTPAAVEED
jgi:hypothetical protein